MKFKRWLVALAILFAAAAASFVCYWNRPSPRAAIPPDPSRDEMEPLIASSVAAMRERVLKEPQSALAWGELGEVFFANSLLEEAQVCFDQAARLDPHSPTWPYLHARILVGVGRRESAVGLLARVVELTQNDERANSFALLALAEAELYLGRIAAAEGHVAECRKRASGDPRTRYDAGLLAAAREDWDAAREHFRECLADTTTRKKARIQLAAVCQRLKDFARADELQLEASRLPNDWDWSDPLDDNYKRWTVKKQSSFALAGELEVQGRIDEAMRSVRSLVERYPDDDFAHAFLGRLLAQKGDFRGSIDSLKRAIQIAPRTIHTHYNLSLILIQQGEFLERMGNRRQSEAAFQEAAKQARDALAIKPDYGYARMALGMSLKHLGKPAEAELEISEAIHCNPENAEMHRELADVLFDLGRKDEARFRYEEALRLAPASVPWRASATARIGELQKSNPKPGG